MSYATPRAINRAKVQHKVTKRGKKAAAEGNKHQIIGPKIRGLEKFKSKGKHERQKT